MGLDISVREKCCDGPYTVSGIHLNGGYREVAALIGADDVLWPVDQSEPFHAKALIPDLCACIGMFGNDAQHYYNIANEMDVDGGVVIGVLCELLAVCAEYPDADVIFSY